MVGHAEAVKSRVAIGGATEMADNYLSGAQGMRSNVMYYAGDLTVGAGTHLVGDSGSCSVLCAQSAPLTAACSL